MLVPYLSSDPWPAVDEVDGWQKQAADFLAVGDPIKAARCLARADEAMVELRVRLADLGRRRNGLITAAPSNN